MEFFKCCCDCYSLAFFSCLVMMLIFNSSAVDVFVQADEPSLQIMSHDDDTMEYWPTKMSLYEYGGGGDLGENEEEMDDGAGGFSRRSLFWHRFKHIYISYGALSSNRIPCPPRSGRSYYTHNCYFAEGPVHPYIRGCSTITRCRR